MSDSASRAVEFILRKSSPTGDSHVLSPRDGTTTQSQPLVAPSADSKAYKLLVDAGQARIERAARPRRGTKEARLLIGDDTNHNDRGLRRGSKGAALLLGDASHHG